MEERLQKIIARAGVASRRKAEKLITDGRVTVNGIVVSELGVKADPDRDEIRVDGKLVVPAADYTYIMLHKPEGVVTTTHDPEGRPTVMQILKRAGEGLFPVGRLDYDSSGLLLITNDGELAHFLLHPSSKLPKTYLVKVKGLIRESALERLRKGVEVEGRFFKPVQVRFLRGTPAGRNSWLVMTLAEGKTRQIRKMCEAVGYQVLKLKRVAIGPLELGELPLGKWRYLTDREISALKRLMTRAGGKKEGLDFSSPGRKKAIIKRRKKRSG